MAARSALYKPTAKIEILIPINSEFALDLYVPVILPGGCKVVRFSAAASFAVDGSNLTVTLAQPSDGPTATITAGTGSYITVTSGAVPWVFPFGPAPTVTTIRLVGPAELSGYVVAYIEYE